MIRPGASFLLSCLSLACLLSFPASAIARMEHASIYICKDEQGRIISSDQPIAACAQRPMRELNQDGSLRRILPPPLTRAEERAAARQELLRQEQERIQRAQQARDRHLLLTYRSTEDLRQRQARQLALIDEEIDAAIKRILVLDKTLQAEKLEARNWLRQHGHADGKLPYTREQRISSIANAILAEDSLIKERRSERERVNKEFAAHAQRLEELLAHVASNEEDERL